MGSTGPGRRGPALWLAGALLGSFLVLAALALAVPAPRSLADEVRYAIAAGALADGRGLGLRGEDYGFGPVYPAILAGILTVVPDRETAYPLFKVANALLFVLAAVPIYVLARRLLPGAWSVAVAVLSLVIPTSVSVSLVMTESVAYLVSSLAMLAIVLALERPTVARQLAVLGLVALAFLTRAQFAVLFPAFVAGLAVLWALAPARRPRTARELAALWPTLGALGLGLALVIAAPLVSGSAPRGLPGAYEELWAGYSVPEVARFVVYHLAGLELYLAVIPLAVAPIVLLGLIRSARNGSAAAGAFASAFVTLNALLILVAAAFASTPAGFGFLHDRYVFYVAPLWLVVLALWLHDGLPRPLVATSVGVALALVLPAFTPFELLAGEGREAGAAVTFFWSNVNEFAFEVLPDEISGRRALALFVIALVAVTVLAPRRLWHTVGATVATVLVAATAIAWHDSVRTAGDFESALSDDRSWVDERARPGLDVTSLYVSAECAWARWTSSGLLLTEFFNASVTRAAHLGDPDQSLIASTPVHASAHRALLDAAGEPLVAEAVLAAQGVELEGRRIATGTTLPLVLWEVDGPVRLAEARTAGATRRAICAAGPGGRGRSASLPSPG